MKIYRNIISLSFLLCSVNAADPISIEAFKKMSLPEQRQAIADAPAEIKKEFEKIYLHAALIAQHGGEAGLKFFKEQFVIRAKGFLPFEHVFGTHSQLWHQYLASEESKFTAKKGGEKEREAVIALEKETLALDQRALAAHDIAFRLAPSARALDLAKRAEKLNAEWRKRWLDSPGAKGITKEQLSEADRQINEIFEQMKSLPSLTPEEAKKEYDTFPEEDLHY